VLATGASRYRQVYTLTKGTQLLQEGISCAEASVGLYLPAFIFKHHNLN
jgi:hypothetical protein